MKVRCRTKHAQMTEKLLLIYWVEKRRTVRCEAGMVELADTLALGASAARHAGSSPVPGTKTAVVSGS